MRDDGWEIPPIPASIIEADDYDQAMKKILALTSQYGRMTHQGLYKFMNDASISMEYVEKHFRFSDVNIPKFQMEFFEMPQIAASKELEEKDFQHFKLTCPKCGFGWDKSE